MKILIINGYSKKWGRDPMNNFAVASYDQNSVDELIDALKKPVDKSDMKAWQIKDDQEYYDAIQAALNQARS